MDNGLLVGGAVLAKGDAIFCDNHHILQLYKSTIIMQNYVYVRWMNVL